MEPRGKSHYIDKRKQVRTDIKNTKEKAELNKGSDYPPDILQYIC